MTPTRADITAVYAGGCAGALARALSAEAWPAQVGAFPWATFAVNVAGTALLGYVVAHRARWRPLVGAGFCGALTTFSGLQLELLAMLDAGRPGLAVAYAASSVAAGLAAASLPWRAR